MKRLVFFFKNSAEIKSADQLKNLQILLNQICHLDLLTHEKKQFYCFVENNQTQGNFVLHILAEITCDPEIISGAIKKLLLQNEFEYCATEESNVLILQSHEVVKTIETYKRTRDINETSLGLVFKFLTKQNLCEISTVNKQFSRVAGRPDLWKVGKLSGKNKVIQAFSLAPGIKTFIFKLSDEKQNNILELLQMDYAQRKQTFASNVVINSSAAAVQSASLLSNEGMIILGLGLLSYEEAAKFPFFISEFGIKILYENLISKNDLNSIQFLPLKSLISKNGYLALKEKLIFLQSLYDKTVSLDLLFTDAGLAFLREGLISVEVASKFVHTGSAGHCSNLSHLINPNGLKALRAKLLTADQALAIDNLQALMTDIGLKMLEEKLITPTQAAKFYHNGALGHCSQLSDLVNPNGYIALKEKLLTPDEAFAIDNLKVLMSEIGLTMLREKLLTPQQAGRMYHSGRGDYCSSLAALVNVEGLTALRENLLSFDAAYGIQSLRELLKVGLEGMRNGLILAKEYLGNNDHPGIVEKQIKQQINFRSALLLTLKNTLPEHLIEHVGGWQLNLDEVKNIYFTSRKPISKNSKTETLVKSYVEKAKAKDIILEVVENAKGNLVLKIPLNDLQPKEFNKIPRNCSS